MNKERVGALIDGVYAIAMTILVLELPIPESGEELSQSITTIAIAIIDYVLAFILLFAFWANQRRINDLVQEHSRLTLWLNGLILMMICLFPFATTLLYRLGGEPSSLFQFNQSALVDLIFIGVCLSADLLIHSLLRIIYLTGNHELGDLENMSKLCRSRLIATAVVILVMFLTFALPGSNRRSLIVIPLVLIFEEELVKAWEWILKPKKPNT